MECNPREVALCRFDSTHACRDAPNHDCMCCKIGAYHASRNEDFLRSWRPKKIQRTETELRQLWAGTTEVNIESVIEYALKNLDQKE